MRKIMEQAEAKFWAAYRIVIKKIKASKPEELAMLATILLMHYMEVEQ